MTKIPCLKCYSQEINEKRERNELVKKICSLLYHYGEKSENG